MNIFVLNAEIALEQTGEMVADEPLDREKAVISFKSVRKKGKGEGWEGDYG